MAWTSALRSFRTAACATAFSSLVGVQPIGTTDNWGLDRIDQVSGRDGSYHYARTGRGESIYVIDTGVLTSHSDFGGRAHYVGDFCTGTLRGPSSSPYETFADGYDGHGTHNASFAAGSRSGVAKEATIYALRAQAPSAPNSASPEKDGVFCGDHHNAPAVHAAVRWIRNNVAAPAVVNISFAFRTSDVGYEKMLTEIRDAIDAGFVFTLSAGSSGSIESHWGSTIPGLALVVAGTDEADRAITNGYGASLSLFAPAKGLYGAGTGSTSDFNVPERCCGGSAGDSFAAPLVAGAAALYLEAHPAATPAEVRTALIRSASPGVANRTGEPDRLLRVPGD